MTTTTEHRIDLPLTKPLSLNDRQHHMARWRETTKLRTAVELLARNVHHIPHYDRISVELHWVPNVRRNRDGDNPIVTVKHCVDGLVRAGVIDDDDTSRVQHLPVVIHEPVKARAGSLYLLIRPIEEAAA